VAFHPQECRPQTSAAIDFPAMIDNIARHSLSGRIQPAPATERDLAEWRKAITFFQAHALDSCRKILARYNYALVQVPDWRNVAAYDVIRENEPIKLGWGTFVYNRNQTKRLYIQVPHPVRDEQSARFGADLFQKLGAEWLMVAGSDGPPVSTDDDITRLNETLFQEWHEMLTDLIHVSISLHTFAPRAFPRPIETTDVVVSNGRTTDEQWGISQLSLSVRDTLRSSRVSCSLAMYDSGYARLSGGASRQGTFSNDSVGFGHWLNVELSDRLVKDPDRTSRFVAAISRALDVTGQRISRQVNNAFGLVSPRVLRLDSKHPLLFPPPEEEYRILSFNSREVKHDTVVIRVGDWINLKEPSASGSTVSALEGRGNDFMHRFGSTSSRKEVARIVEEPFSHLRLGKGVLQDSSIAGDDDRTADEPLQVHRIPLEPVLASTVTGEYLSAVTPFRWEGTIAGDFSPNPGIFRFASAMSMPAQMSGPEHMFIPIMNSSYGTGKSKFVGVQMTSILLDQITRLAEAARADRDITLLAEQDDSGKYFLRVFPGAQHQQETAMARPR
jgi:hypothetical protein